MSALELSATPSSKITTSSPPPTSINNHQRKVVDIAVGGMTCSMCTSAVEQGLSRIQGILSVSVSLSTNLARVEFQEPPLTAGAIADEIEDLGYDVTDIIIMVPSASIESTQRQTVELTVGGMTCSMCSSAVHKALTELPNVVSVNVSLSTNIARIEYEDTPDVNYPDDLVETVEDIGYDVSDVMIVHAGVSSTTTATATADNNINNSSFPVTVEQIEHTEDRLSRILKQQEAQLAARRTAFLWSFAGALPIMIITMVIPHLFPPSNCIRRFLGQHVTLLGLNLLVEAIIVWLLTTPVQFVCGYSFYKTSYHGIMRRVLGMDVLVALGTTASYLYAFIAMLKDDVGYRFFETSAVLICFVLLGKWMNAMAVQRTSLALTQLMKLQAKTAIKVIPDKGTHKNMDLWNPLKDSYQEQVVPIQAIHPGDVVKILKGASIPADGVVFHGELTVDQSMITGESIPVLKVPGDDVLGGTICCESGTSDDSTVKSQSHTLTAAAFIRVTGVGADSALAQIVQLVQEAQSRQVPIQNLADSIASIFVPVVVALSFLTFLAWYGCCKGGIVPSSWYQGESPATFSLLFGIACLVISCPCALGLATPTAIMVGTGVGARHGVLMKGGETLEVASKVDTILFDKTGTLTRGKPAVTDFQRIASDEFLRSFLNSDDSEIPVDDFLIWLLGSLERNSEHVLATAIVKFAEEKIEYLLEKKAFSQPSNFVALTGRGASGLVEDRICVAIGNRAFAERQKMILSPDVEECMVNMELEGKTAMVAGINGTVCAVLGVADEVKEEAANSVRYLKKMGLDIWMITGDSKRTAHAIARQLNLHTDRVIAEALPSSKVDLVQRLQSEGKIVAMVGDGVNDSPALAEADVGISMGTGAEIANEASDMVIVSGKVSGTCTALHLSRVIFRRIQWNFGFSMIYNVLSIPLAAGVFFPIFHTRLPPTIAAIAMALSSVSVVFSSLALRLYSPPDVSLVERPTFFHRRIPQILRPRQQYEHIPADCSDDSGDEILEFHEEIV
ncbi:copper-transporting P-type ATPase [Nitzschia inconspicua]|uniref:Copper-transporting P-type ATPase n=1 Tax=Nitzschia inconspicua TaxID=303405 RepID=A0A9K3LFV8_9STRA|nr:copper-transporting P-type ATPase [Nitzschia inconspicua]